MLQAGNKTLHRESLVGIKSIIIVAIVITHAKTRKMSIAKSLACGGLLLSVLGAGAQEKKQEHPNVLMLVADDWNDMIGAFGNNQAKTPNMDKFCKRGVKFTSNQTAAAYCTPSRTALMTGIGAWNSGCYGEHPHHYNLPDQKTIPLLFQENGYQTYGGGKVYHHMPGYLDLKGYDEYFHWNPAQKKKGWGVKSWDNNPATPVTAEFGNKIYKNFDIVALPNEMEKEMADTKMVDWAVELLKKKHDAPFFLSAGLYAPHKPNYVPQKYFDMYPISEIKLPEIKEGDELDLPPLVQKIIKQKSKHTHQKVNGIENGWKRAIQGYLAAVSYADAQLGRILNQLEKSPYAKNTVIVFWSDNGYHLGEKQCWAKHTLWERTTNVPMIWAGKGIAKNKEYKGVTSLLDIYPTLVDVCNLKGAQKLDGESIQYALKKPARVKDRAVITSKKTGDSFSVYTNKWHYLSYKFGQADELYDVEKDPNEWDNLAEKSEFKKIVEEMKAYLPKNPAPIAAGRESIKLVFEGESFKWVEKTEAEKQAYLARQAKKANKKKNKNKGKQNKKHKNK